MRALSLSLSRETLKELDNLFPGPGGTAPEAYAWYWWINGSHVVDEVRDFAGLRSVSTGQRLQPGRCRFP